MNKSYQSIKQIKDRMSQSRLSQRSQLSRQSSSKSLNSSQTEKGSKDAFQGRKDHPPLHLRACSINRTDSNALQKFRGLFQRDPNIIIKPRKTAEDGLRHKGYYKN